MTRLRNLVGAYLDRFSTVSPEPHPWGPPVAGLPVVAALILGRPALAVLAALLLLPLCVRLRPRNLVPRSDAGPTALTSEARWLRRSDRLCLLLAGAASTLPWFLAEARSVSVFLLIGTALTLRLLLAVEVALHRGEAPEQWNLAPVPLRQKAR